MIKYWFPHLSNISSEVKIGEGSVIHAGVHIHDGVIIGKNCQIEAQVFIPNGVTIEDDCFIGPQVCFTNDPTMALERKNWLPTPTLVKKGAKIGAGAKIRAGVKIGANSIIGMGSVVLCDIPDGETWVGVPAKRLDK